MAISTLGRSGNIVWSRNPIFYSLQYSITAGRSIQVQLMDSDLNIAIGEPLRYTVPSAFGVLNVFDLEKIIDPYLTWEDPLSGDPLNNATIQQDNGMKKYVHLKYREYSLAAPSEAWTDDIANKFLVVKGGIGDMSFTGELELNSIWYPHLFYPNPDGNAHPWLSFRGVYGNVIHAKEWRYLLYHHNAIYEPVFIFFVTYTDGTTQNFYRFMLNRTAPFITRFLRIPVGIEQQGLCPPGKKVLKYSLTVRANVTGVSPVYAVMEFEVDNRPVHNYMNLFYRTSVGGIETIFLTGTTLRNGGSFEKKEFEGNRLTATRSGPNNNFYSEGRLKFTANTGYEIGKKELMLMYDLFNNTDFCAVRYAPPLQNPKWLAMKVPAQDMEPINSDNFLHGYKIEFESAGSFRNFPRDILNNLVG